MKSKLEKLEQLDDTLIRAILENPKILEIMPDEIVFFDFKEGDWEHIFTPKRLELLHAIHSKNPKSLSELADITGRSVENVYRDIKLLKKFDIVKTEKSGRKSKPKVTKVAAMVTF
ncbi:MAG: helix-turn-helix domain-containing protein [Candidatus Undinarchaeales archaeon]